MTDVAVTSPQRIAHLDILRGLGVLGILAVNAIAFSQPFQAFFDPRLAPIGFEGTDVSVWWGTHVFAERKFITLFTMLFGASLFLVGGERHDPVRGPVLTRRLLWLAVFGLIHGLLIWFGDVLLLYAVAGLILLLCRSWGAGLLFVLGALLFWSVSLLLTGLMILMASIPEAQAGMMEGMAQMFSAELAQQSVAAYQSGLQGAFGQNLEAWLFTQPSQSIVYLLPTLGLMMIGLGLLKTGFLQGRAPLFVYLLFVALGAAALVAIAMQANINLANLDDRAFLMSWGQATNSLLAPVVTLGYVSVVALLLKFGAKAILTPLANVGRMAFTNYIMQSVIMTSIFWGGRGLGLMGELTRTETFWIVVGIWVFQLIVSTLWLAKFKQGPLEAGWRRLSFGKSGRPEPVSV